MLAVHDLRIRLRGVELVRGIDFALAAGETLGLIGESGSGKSLTALALMGLLPDGAEVSGRLLFDGVDLLGLDEKALCALRGRRIAMIFQEPMSALNPLHRIGAQVAEPLRLQLGMSRTEAQVEAQRLLKRVGLDDAARYPHQLSGGQRQRVMIAIALACGPQLLIADEPTTALDANLQRQTLDLLAELVAERGMALLLISHDLALVAHRVQRLMVMYAGRVVESGPVASVFSHLAHPYTQGLVAARPRLGLRQRLPAMRGTAPDLRNLAEGCSFRPRCPRAAELCKQDPASQTLSSDGHWAACLRIEEGPGRG